MSISHRQVARSMQQIDPLYIIFEQHLYNFEDADADRRTFVDNVIQDYLAFLRKKSIAVPKSLEPSIIEELGTQVRSMLIKKIYGCLTIQDYQKRQPSASKRRARSRYTKLVKMR